MTSLLEIREMIKIFCSSYERYVMIAARFLLGLITLFMIRGALGSGKPFEGVLIVILLAVLCGVLGNNIMVLVCGVFLIAELFYLSMPLAAVMFLIAVLFFCLYLAVAPEDGMILLLSAVCCGAGLPFLMPVAAGLTRKINSAIPVGFGVFTYYIVKAMETAATGVTDEETSPLSVMMSQLAQSKELILMLILSVATVCAVYFIRRMSIDYSWWIAILFGMVLQLLVVLVGNFAFSLHIGLIRIFLGFAIAVIICLILQFFAFNLDYRRVERVQFEDTEYYYYVKAVPKVRVAPQDKQEKVISPARKEL